MTHTKTGQLRHIKWSVISTGARERCVYITTIMIEIVVAYVTLKVKWGPDKSRTELCSRVFHSFCDLEFDESSITLSILLGASLFCFVDNLVPLVCVVALVAVVVEVVELSSS